jgi:transposase
MKEFESLSREQLIKVILMQQKRIKELETMVTELLQKLNKNSRNSSKPPSSDGFKKPNKTKSERTKSQRSTGGQIGHQGHTLSFSNQPDHTVNHELSTCPDCGMSLEEETVLGYTRRQAYDMPQVSIEVTEHRAQQKYCPKCERMKQATFPESVPYPIQYGVRLQALVMYWHHYQLIPYERTVEMLRDLTGHPFSEGTIANMSKRLYALLEPTERAIKEQILASACVNMDETGLAVNGKLKWLHVYSTDQLTYYAEHEKRGTKAMEDIGILPVYQGVAVHDAWRSYFQFDDCEHALCGAHLLREFTFLFEQEEQEWAKDLHDLLIQMKNMTDERHGQELDLTPSELVSFEQAYDEAVRKGNSQNPPVIQRESGRGRIKQTPSRNLLDRLILHRSSILAFLYDRNVPFDNNQAERDVRMTKVKQKISGTFRSHQGAKMFCRIRGFISTAKKQGKELLNSIERAFSGESILP